MASVGAQWVNNIFRARRAAKEAKDAPAQPQPVRSILFPHTNGFNNTCAESLRLI
jgi:hypothetical protein